ncbi:AAA family ATPase [Bifidobacterium sp. MA2]|uniref:AAA family ATPase n=1 Tax=Bifidobacterium santillanense TaxID=2809028 RepID=A0ABS5USF1_9BIFI|nr:AAA family ATPase [Bifidobacterium santillanense]MBT1173864.1 AAA family ATPase [Bifidobacterium santillanense]
MRLDRLEMRNYRRFAELSVGFEPDVTVLVGGNGMGKTAVLDAAAVMLGAFLAKFPDVSGPSIQRSDARRVRYEVGGVYDTQQQFPVSLAAEGEAPMPVVWDRYRQGQETLGGRLEWGRALRGPEGKMTVADAQPMIAVSDEYRGAVMADPSVVLPLVAYYGTDRLWPRDRRQWRTHSDAYLQAGNRFGGYDGCLGSSVSYKQMATWFRKMTAEQERRKTVIPSFQAVRTAVSACLERLTGHADARIDYADGGMLVTYTAPDGTVCEDEPFETLSDGYRATIGMVADIARRMATLNPVMGGDAVRRTPGVVLIDEVDLHLHPLWQEHVVSMLTALFPAVQFVLTTHAPLVIASVPGRQVRMLSYDPSNGVARAAEPSFETYGQPASDTLTSVQGAHDLPEPVRGALDAFETALDDGDYAGAKRELDRLHGMVGETNSEYVSARTAYDFMRGAGGGEDD